MEQTESFKKNLLLGTFCALLIGMNLLGGKLIALFGISVSVGIFMMPLTFLITDMVAEVYGPKVARQFVLIGVISIVLILIYTAIFVVLPPHERYTFNSEYQTIFGASIRILLASFIAFLFAQIHDVWAFEFWKKKTKGKMLWLRNNLSTMVSQAIDTFIFMMIAFYMLTPKFTFLFIIELSIPFYLFKILFALIDTPLVYLGVKWLRGGKKEIESKNES